MFRRSRNYLESNRSESKTLSSVLHRGDSGRNISLSSEKKRKEKLSIRSENHNPPDANVNQAAKNSFRCAAKFNAVKKVASTSERKLDSHNQWSWSENSPREEKKEKKEKCTINSSVKYKLLSSITHGWNGQIMVLSMFIWHPCFIFWTRFKLASIYVYVVEVKSKIRGDFVSFLNVLLLEVKGKLKGFFY